jgi:hypothetical protein
MKLEEAAGRPRLLWIVLLALGLRFALGLLLLPDRLDPRRDHAAFDFELGKVAASITSGRGFSDCRPLRELPVFRADGLAHLWHRQKMFQLKNRNMVRLDLCLFSLQCLLGCQLPLGHYSDSAIVCHERPKSLGTGAQRSHPHLVPRRASCRLYGLGGTSRARRFSLRRGLALLSPCKVRARLVASCFRRWRCADSADCSLGRAELRCF